VNATITLLKIKAISKEKIIPVCTFGFCFLNRARYFFTKACSYSLTNTLARVKSLKIFEKWPWAPTYQKIDKFMMSSKFIKFPYVPTFL
jgi:hypothetical protein